MIDHILLKKHLIESGRMTQDEMARAEDYALTASMPLDESIIFLKMLNYTALGQCLAEIYQKPYLPLMAGAPDEAARLKVPLKIAETLHIFPVHYDAKAGTLKVAVSDPKDEHLLDNLKKRLSSTFLIEETVACPSEIDMAIDVYYKGRLFVREPELHIPKDFTIMSHEDKTAPALDLDEDTRSTGRILLLEPDLERSRALLTLLKREGFSHVKWAASVKEALKAYEEEPADRVMVNGKAFNPQSQAMKPLTAAVTPSSLLFYNIRNMLLTQEHPYAQMSASILALVQFIVRKALRDQQDRLAEIIATARYCKLLAMRMGLPAVSVDGAVLAAWLSVPGMGRVIYDHMASPYPLDEIFETDRAETISDGVENRILKLVRKYQALRKEMPERVGDMNYVRKNILPASEAPEDRALVEAFLNVMKDDEFLKDAGRSRRRVLVVDPGYSGDSPLALRLSNDGYELIGVADTKAAAGIIFDSGVDVVISEVHPGGTDGLRFCRALRENAATSRLPFFFLTQENGGKLATDCLEAGADDFFKKPPDLEWLSIKIRNTLAMKSTRGGRSGITGTLQDMSFTDIIQSLTTGDKDVEIRFQSGSQQGTIYIQHGEVIFAQAQELDGQDAFYRMMTWQDGEFEITASRTVPQRNIFESAMSLLMEGARMADDESNLPDDEA